MDWIIIVCRVRLTVLRARSATWVSNFFPAIYEPLNLKSKIFAQSWQPKFETQVTERALRTLMFQGAQATLLCFILTYSHQHF